MKAFSHGFLAGARARLGPSGRRRARSREASTSEFTTGISAIYRPFLRSQLNAFATGAMSYGDSSGRYCPTSAPPPRGSAAALPAPPSSEPTPAARLPGLNRLNSSVRRGTLRTKGAGLHRAILPVNGAIAISKQREGQLDDKRKTVEFSVRLEKSLACDLPSSSSSPSIYLPIKMAPLTGRTHTMQISLVCFLSEPLSRRNTLDSKEQEIGTPAQTSRRRRRQGGRRSLPAPPS